MTALDVAAWPAIGLEQLEQEAALQTRVDRKYVVMPTLLAAALDEVGDALRVLEIDGARAFTYRSTYFDTPDLLSYRAAAAGRSPRFKVRTRAYVTTRSSWLEVKLRDRRGRTHKHRVEHHDLELDAGARSFLDGFDEVRPCVEMLAPSIATAYERTTLVCSARRGEGSERAAGQRATIDVGVSCRLPDGTPVAGLGRHLIVETKSPSARPGPLDRALWRAGARPVPISKYAAGVACARPDLTANRWRRTLHRYVQPATADRTTRSSPR